jgi:hypothetical protein
MNTTAYLLIAALCTLSAPLASPGVQQSAQQTAVAQEEAWHFETVAPEIRARRDRILAEIATGKAGEWAGWYTAYPSEDGSTGVLWAPESGYLLYLGPDGPYLEDVSYGGCSLDEGVLRLRPEAPIAKRRWPYNTFFSEFRCVRWGSSRYLVPPDRLVQFCDAVASGDIHEVGLFLGMDRGRDWPPAGRPEVPAEYRKYLDSKPVTARVKSKSETRSGADYTETRVVLSAGTAEGIRPEMKFWLREPRVRATVPMEIRVNSVGKHTSEAVVVSFPAHRDTGEWLNPKVGWRFQNRLPKTAL